jgi:hypothetical protein
MEVLFGILSSLFGLPGIIVKSNTVRALSQHLALLVESVLFRLLMGYSGTPQVAQTAQVS